jgi:hypothetical protein
MKIFLIVYTYGVLLSSGEVLSTQVTPVNSMPVCEKLASKVKSIPTSLYAKDVVVTKCIEIKE